MADGVGTALVRFDESLRSLRQALGVDPRLAEAVFDGADAWTDLLSYKLVPQLGGDGCLIVAVAGGTNTGKSTVFNLLLGRAASPVAATAAATRRPLLAASPARAQQCLDGRLTPEFHPLRLGSADDVLDSDAPAAALYVAESESLPDRLVLLDTPDVDSIERENWDVAEHIRALGDVIVAVVTGEKYRDERVVAFFRQAQRSGRVILPLMNKADPRNGYAVARRQLSEFCADVGIDGPCFVAPHDFDLGTDAMAPIAALDDGRPDLLQHLLAIDVRRIKEDVFRGSVDHVARQAEGFVTHAGAIGAQLRSTADEFRDRAHRAAEDFDPLPGAEVGGLFHDFVQERRGPVRRWIGSTSKTVVKGVTTAGRTVFRSFRKRTRLEADPMPPSEEEVRAVQEQAVERITRTLAAGYIETCPNLREPAAHLVAQGLAGLEVDSATVRVVRDTLRGDRISEEFRRHAHRMLEAWWNDHRGQRHVVEALDALLAATPAAIAVPIAIYTGPGLPEATVAIAGPFVEQFAARVFEYQFGDAMFDFLSPWRKERRAAFAEAMERHVTDRALSHLEAASAPLDGGAMAELRAALAELTEAMARRSAPAS